MTPLEVILVGGLGVAAGVIGGLAGVGGSMAMLPGLHLVYPASTPEQHHLFVAAAMSVNLAVAVPAAIQHARAGAVRWEWLPTIVVAALVMIGVGVAASNRVDGNVLSVWLGGFILCYCGYNLWRTARGRGGDDPGPERVTRAKLAAGGAAAGTTAGLLGLGGGVVLVPMLQVLCRAKLKQSIATSSAAICVTSFFGAGMKLATLGEHGQHVGRALELAGIMAPGAIVGGIAGARLTHAMPVKGVRIAVTLLLAVAAVNLVRRGL